jgi:hypothetical protein
MYWSSQREQSSGSPPLAFGRYLSRLFGFAVRGGFLLVAWHLPHDRAHAGWLILCLICGLPWLLIELILIPLHAPYPVYYSTRVLYPHAVFGEGRGLAVFNELRSRVRWGWGLLQPDKLARLSRNLVAFDAEGSDRAVAGASLAARAMLDALAGEGERARELFDVVQTMDRWHACRSARVFSQAWLLGDAAGRGAYHDVVRLSRRGPITFRRSFMGAAARRILGHPDAAANWKLIAWWLLSPARIHALGLLKLALHAKARAAHSAPEPGLTAAKRCHVELMRLPRGAATRGELAQLAWTWQTVLDSGQIHGIATERRQVLQAAFDPSTIEARFERQLVNALGELLRNTLPDGASESDSPMLLLSAMDELQGDWLSELEDLCQSLARGSAHTTNDLEQHWRTWARLRHLATLLSDILPERAHLIYESVGVEVLNHGAWLYNDERARLLAHDVFCFLRAIAPKDDANWRTIRQNARLSR